MLYKTLSSTRLNNRHFSKKFQYPHSKYTIKNLESIKCKLARFQIKTKKHSISTRASSTGTNFEANDPFKILGVSQNSNSENIQKAYKIKLKEAKDKGDEQLITMIENAHSTIVMRQLTQRIQGSSNVSKEIAYADKTVYFPWKPRYYRASKQMMLICIAIHCILLSWALLVPQTASTQPLIGSTLTCVVMSYLKLEEVFPAGGAAFSADKEDQKQGGKNLRRSIVLGLMGIISGIVLFYTLPDLIANLCFKTKLPLWFYESQNTILNCGVILANTILILFYR